MTCRILPRCLVVASLWMLLRRWSKRVSLEVLGKLPSNGYPVFKREMDAPTDVCIPTKGQPQGEGYGVELLCVHCS